MANENQEKRFILRLKQVQNRIGLSRSSIYLRIQEGKFPKPVNLGARAVGWLESDVDAWLADLVEQRDRMLAK